MHHAVTPPGSTEPRGSPAGGEPGALGGGGGALLTSTKYIDPNNPETMTVLDVRENKYYIIRAEPWRIITP
jgi:hypothetical protein